MESRRIGALSVSTAGLGCASFGWFINERKARDVISVALDVGITHFDTADEYGEGVSEECLGRALGGRRSAVVITTKFGSRPPPGGSRPASAAWIRRACEASLARLKSDWIDLYLLHHPDKTTPIAETLTALGELKTAGKVREIGCSNFTPEQVSEAAAVSAALGIGGFQTVECGYSLLDRTAESTLIPECSRQGIPILPFFPLASGMLTGKYRRGDRHPEAGRLGQKLRGGLVRDYFPALLTDECFDIVEALERYAADHGHSLVELALGWLASKPYVASVIAGATSPEQLRSNVAAISSWSLTKDQQAEVANITRTDVSYLWLADSPAYSNPPDSVNRASAPSVPPLAG
jgi:aryl-alcohol dehydrogenase-like predicted oxidoreductase